MVYKLANVTDLEKLPSLDPRTHSNLYELTNILSSEYGTDRNVDSDDGGYVLYATPGTTSQELKRWFNYSAHPVEYVNQDLHAEPPLCSAFFILNNDYVVTIVMSIADAPFEVTQAFEEGY